MPMSSPHTLFPRALDISRSRITQKSYREAPGAHVRARNFIYPVTRRAKLRGWLVEARRYTNFSPMRALHFYRALMRRALTVLKRCAANGLFTGQRPQSLPRARAIGRREKDALIRCHVPCWLPGRHRRSGLMLARTARRRYKR